MSGELISVSEVESELPSASTTAPPTPNPHPRLATPEYINNVASWDVVHDPKKAVKGIYSKRKKSTEKETTPQLALNFPCKGITASVLQCLHCLYKVGFLKGLTIMVNILCITMSDFFSIFSFHSHL